MAADKNSNRKAAKALIGTTIQRRYHVVRLLGDGGMGAVYKAADTVLRRFVAIKLLHPATAENPSAVERFVREARSSAAIGHPNIIDVLDFGYEDKRPYLVMEYLRGRSLSEAITEEKRLSVARSCNIATHSLAGLAAAHDRGILHRDLKPANMMLIALLGDRDFVKLCDFGFAALVQPSVRIDGGKSLTPARTLVGTPAYAAPERLRGDDRRDPRLDVWSIGVVLFEMLAGRRPFDAPTFRELARKIRKEPAPSLRSIRGDVPRGLDAVVQKALAKEREQRFTSAAEFAAALVPFGGRVIPDFADAGSDSFTMDLLRLRARETQQRVAIDAQTGHPLAGADLDELRRRFRDENSDPSIIARRDAIKRKTERAPEPPRYEPPKAPTRRPPPPVVERRPAEPRRGEPRAPEPRAAQPRAPEPRAAQPRAPEPRAPEPRAAQPRAPEPRAAQPRAPQPRAPQPRAPEPRAEPRRAEQVPPPRAGDAVYKRPAPPRDLGGGFGDDPTSVETSRRRSEAKRTEPHLGGELPLRAAPAVPMPRRGDPAGVPGQDLQGQAVQKQDFPSEGPTSDHTQLGAAYDGSLGRDKSVRGALPLSVLRFVSRRFGERKLTDLLHTLPKPAAEVFAGGIDGSSWIGYDDLNALASHIDATLGRDDLHLVVQCGRAAAESAFERMRAVKPPAPPPQDLMRAMPDVIDEFYRGLSARVTRLGNGFARLQLEELGESSLVGCVFLIGFLDRSLDRFGAKEVEVNLSSTPALGDEEWIYDISWLA